MITESCGRAAKRVIVPNVALEARQRSSESWLTDLQSADPNLQSSALVDLRDFIRRALGKSLGGRGGVDEAILEDFSQEASIRVVDRIDTFRGESKFTTWVLSIALRVAFSELRRHRWRDVSLEQFDTEPLTEAPSWQETALSAQTLTHRNQVVHAMYRVINHELTERQRTVVLAELKGIPAVVIEETLGTNRNALYKLLHDARKRLLKGLCEAGITADDVREAFAS